VRIAHIGRFSRDKVDGVSTAVYTLAEAQARAGHQVFFYALGPEDRSAIDPAGIQIKEFRRSRNPFYVPAGLVRALKPAVDGIDIFHLHSVFVPANYAMARNLLGSAQPYVITPHGGYDRQVFRRGRLKKRIYFALFERHCVYGAVGIVCVTKPECKDIRRLGFDGSIVIIPNAVRARSYIDIQRIPRNQLMYMGRNDIENKGLDRLLRLFSRVESLDNSISLEFYSGEQNRNAVQEIIEQMGIKNAHLNEPVFGAQKLHSFAHASAYIQTSRWEVFGISIAEAMMSGVPVAVSRECYLSSVVEQTGCGMVIERYDEATAKALIKIVEDSELNAAMGLMGKAYAVENFDADEVAHKTVDFYQTLLQRR
jgi:glycosyltransferase involved in cell wall biosynthesis